MSRSTAHRCCRKLIVPEHPRRTSFQTRLTYTTRAYEMVSLPPVAVARSDSRARRAPLEPDERALTTPRRGVRPSQVRPRRRFPTRSAVSRKHWSASGRCGRPSLEGRRLVPCNTSVSRTAPGLGVSQKPQISLTTRSRCQSRSGWTHARNHDNGPGPSAQRSGSRSASSGDQVAVFAHR